jgi:hypothetical protein
MSLAVIARSESDEVIQDRMVVLDCTLALAMTAEETSTFIPAHSPIRRPRLPLGTGCR